MACIFETSAVLINLIHRKWCEAPGQRPYFRSHRKLLKTANLSRHYVNSAGWSDTMVSVKELQQGDGLWQIKPGQQIPVDGLIVEGQSQYG